MSGRARNKTLAAWLAALVGSLGIHRFYLRGVFDWIGWLHAIAAGLGWWGVERVRLYGQDDPVRQFLRPRVALAQARLHRPVRLDARHADLAHVHAHHPSLGVGGLERGDRLALLRTHEPRGHRRERARDRGFLRAVGLAGGVGWGHRGVYTAWVLCSGGRVRARLNHAIRA